MTWIFDSYLNTLDDEINEDNLAELNNTLIQWKDLLNKTITEKKDKEVLIIVLEKIADVRPELENFFKNIVLNFKNMGILSDEDIEEWKKLENASYVASLDENIEIDSELHSKLKELMNLGSKIILNIYLIIMEMINMAIKLMYIILSLQIFKLIEPMLRLEKLIKIGKNYLV